MAMNIEQRLEQSAKSIEQSSQKAHDFAEKDTTIQTCAGSRDSLPKVSRIWQENFARQMNQHATEFQDRFALSQQSLPWQAGITISDSLQRYHVGVQGEEGYKEFLPNPLKLPFETAATLADDLTQDRWLENGVPNKHWTERKVASSLEKSFGVNARVWPKDRDLQVGDVIPAAQETADGLPITHLVVNGNAYAMSPLASGLVSALSKAGATIGGVTTRLASSSRFEVESVQQMIDIATASSIGAKFAVQDYYGKPNENGSGLLFFTCVEDGTSTHDGGKCIQGNGVQFIQNLKRRVKATSFGIIDSETEDQTQRVKAILALNKPVDFESMTIGVSDTIVFSGVFNQYENAHFLKLAGDINLAVIDGLVNSKFTAIIFDGNNAIGSGKGGYGTNDNNLAFTNTNGIKSEFVFFEECQFLESQNRGLAIEISSTAPNQWVEGVYLTRCLFDNNRNMGLQCNNGKDIHLSCCKFNDGENTSLQFGGNTDSVSCCDSIFDNQIPNAIGSNASNAKYLRNKITITKKDAFGSSGEYAIFSYKTTSANGDGVYIQGNEIVTKIEAESILGGVYIKGGNNVHIDDNDISGPFKDESIYVKWADHLPSSPVYQQEPTGVFISRNSSRQSKGGGIRVFKTLIANVESNQVFDCAGVSYYFIDSNVNAVGNWVRKSGGVPSMLGMKVENDKGETVLSGNNAIGVNLYADDYTKLFALTPTRRLAGSVVIKAGATFVDVPTNAGVNATSVSFIPNYDAGKVWAESSLNYVRCRVGVAPTVDKAIYYNIDFSK